jgi:hypothetical protein
VCNKLYNKWSWITKGGDEGLWPWSYLQLTDGVPTQGSAALSCFYNFIIFLELLFAVCASMMQLL